MFIKFLLPRTNLLKRYHLRLSKLSYSTDLPVNNVKNFKLYSFLMKYRFIQKKYHNPKYAKYFHDLFNSSTSSVITAFFILHEVTAFLPFVLLWVLLYQNWSDLKEKLISIPEKLQSTKPDENSGRIQRFIGGKIEAIEKLVARLMTRYVKQEKYSAEELKNLTMTGIIAYTTIKVIAPFRIMLCVMWTPRLSRFFQKTVNLVLRR